MTSRLRSLQLRLVVPLVALFVAGAAVMIGFIVWRAYDTADSLADRELSLRATDLANAISRQPDGSARLELPQALRDAYGSRPDADIFAVRSAEGRLIAASPAAFGALVERWPAATEDAGYFHLPELAGMAQDYYGLGLRLDSAAGPVSVWVGRSSGSTALVHSMLEEFVFDIAWVIPLFMLLTLGIAILAIRRALRPVRELSNIAGSIGPSTTAVRLPQASLPSEMEPLVAAVNRALDRLEQGFAVQRQFTADAAHELRTPLAIVTGALDGMPASPDVEALKLDVARMNRLVEQLLSVARLDAIALDVSATVDLNDVARQVVANLAPWAVAQSRTLAFVAAERPVLVKGNVYAIDDAIRNLVENAVAHAPTGSEIVVSTQADGSVTVGDCGPGVPEQDRERIFERFWRGKAAPAHGAGLGLAIVAEIMKAHGGSARVTAGPQGGAVFTLAFPMAANLR
ncbi:MAG: sensor histidine kinase N-terminal domain-containing protein [Alphaproteobacteria bacterium]|nr:sensor histidine kinase N-terminal domain-containing protein [Alphaproteobacteria bacterium]MBV8406674.1 sensor histidine kinase N-terminal domain-containing protein [Alphaproteobacteria bacterium]